MDLYDLRIVEMSGPEPSFDPVMRNFLVNCAEELRTRHERGGLLDYACLGRDAPWLYRLTFRTRGLARNEGEVVPAEQHVVALRFLPDYLRRADRFEMLALLEPRNAFHPNLMPPAVCVEVRPGEPLVEICESLHALFAWRLRQLAENDAVLNKDACAWGRAHLDELPVDTRPLFGRPFRIVLDPVEEKA